MTGLINYITSKMHRINQVHFIGIGGSGMNGIANILLNQGYKVSGSDLEDSPVVQHLRSLGAQIYLGQQEDNLRGVSIVVVSSAIKENNPELIAARKLKLPIMRRAEMLAEIMRFRAGITVSGTHGKTTTTAMLASIFGEAGLDPTFINGGVIKAYNSTARLGTGHYLIAEADESDASFLHLNPMTAIVTNIEADHMENYANDFNKMKDSYVRFLHNVPFYGLVVACGDYATSMELIPELGRKVITYGFKEHNDYVIFDYIGKEFSCSFKVKHQQQVYQLSLGVPGRHNAANATGAMVVALDENISFDYIQQALTKFNGTGRRFDYLGKYTINQVQNVMILDDYGHHPTELKATIETARISFPQRRLVMLFEPHRYSRSKYFFHEFVEVLDTVDLVILTATYAAGESIIAGSESKDLANQLRGLGKEVYLVNQTQTMAIQQIIEKLVHDDDLLLIQGAGIISKTVRSILPSWKISDN